MQTVPFVPFPDSFIGDAQLNLVRQIRTLSIKTGLLEQTSFLMLILNRLIMWSRIWLRTALRLIV